MLIAQVPQSRRRVIFKSPQLPREMLPIQTLPDRLKLQVHQRWDRCFVLYVFEHHLPYDVWIGVIVESKRLEVLSRS